MCALSRAGGLIGDLCGQNLFQSGTVRGTVVVSGATAGGVAGLVQTDAILHLLSQISQIFSGRDVTVVGQSGLGGLVGYCNALFVSQGFSESYSKATLNGTSSNPAIGGLIGLVCNSLSFLDCYSSVVINAPAGNQLGMIVGFTNVVISTLNLFFLNQSSLNATGS